MTVQKFAHVTSGVVDNVLILDSTDTKYPREGLVGIDGLNPQPSIGWSYDGTTFTFGQTSDQIQAANGQALRTKGTQAVTANRAYSTPPAGTTTANRLTSLETQVERLTRQNTALILLVLNQLDDISGT